MREWKMQKHIHRWDLYADRCSPQSSVCGTWHSGLICDWNRTREKKNRTDEKEMAINVSIVHGCTCRGVSVRLSKWNQKISRRIDSHWTVEYLPKVLTNVSHVVVGRRRRRRRRRSWDDCPSQNSSAFDSSLIRVKHHHIECIACMRCHLPASASMRMKWRRLLFTFHGIASHSEWVHLVVIFFFAGVWFH